jgi:parvulin-like peptidyl-prolyl isomerase
VDSGSNFADLARLYHQGSQRSQGGDWGWVDQTVLRDDLSAVAFSLKEGEMSEVLQKDEGCYLMYVEERQEPKPKPLSAVQEEIEKALLAEERNRLKAEWIDQLKEKSFVRYF